MKGLSVGDSALLKVKINEVNPNGTYTVEVFVDGDQCGYLALMVPTSDVTTPKH